MVSKSRGRRRRKINATRVNVANIPGGGLLLKKKINRHSWWRHGASMQVIEEQNDLIPMFIIREQYNRSFFFGGR